MALFQQSVLRKYSSELPKSELAAKWQLFKTLFHDPVKQQNIRAAKEEQYQEGFLRELFVQVLDYTLNPQPQYNLTTEYKNERDSRKADGAVLHEGKVVAVIELKGTETTDLGKVENQAFGYKHNQKDCTYVITSNFEKLRFYVQDAVDYEEFDLFTLTEERFALLWLCLHKDSLLGGTPLSMKQQSLAQEDAITKKLYADYSQFKRKLFESLRTLNPEIDQLLLFKKTQKLLDRFLFILFAEDRLLLPPNFIIKIVEEWKQVQKLRLEQSLYQRFKLYFNDLHTGNKEEEIFAYNGGLFEPDDLLNGLRMDDSILMEGVLSLSRYDYNTEVDVNILGHIFEHSLNEIEELQAQLQGTSVDKGKTKRKKDGVFYTPRYITKYIVENTVGALCSEKKNELQIIEEDYAPNKKKSNKKELLNKLDAYRQWLRELTICDPACGSGAFLNAALDFLIAEHRYVDELNAKLLGYSMVLADAEKEILEHNLYGVDINEEAVEIARLSLWLRTAQKGRKLSNLSNKIKCGNSLVDEVAISGESAFDWNEAFPIVIEKGGFDVIIGNPPYGASFKDIEKSYLINRYKTYQYKFESYIYFIEKGVKLLNSKGLLSYITPELWLSLETAFALRDFLAKETDLIEINIIGENVFYDAVVNTIIFIASKHKTNRSLKFKKGDKTWEVDPTTWKQHHQKAIEYRILPEYYSILNKLVQNSIPLATLGEVIQGLTPYDKYKGQDPEIIKTRGYHYNFKKDDTCGKWLNGEDLSRYTYSWGGEWLSYGEWLAAPRDPKFFQGPRLLFREIPGKSRRIQATFVDEVFYYGHSITPFILNKEDNCLLMYILSIVNSNLLSWYGKIKLPNFGKDIFPKLNPQDIKLFPILDTDSSLKQQLIIRVDAMLSKTKELQGLKSKLIQLLNAKYENIVISKKLSEWPSISFKEFVKEIDKGKIKLSLYEQAEWMHHFEEEKSKATALQEEITQTDKEIDVMVYKLYKLTDEEIAIIEASN